MKLNRNPAVLFAIVLALRGASELAWVAARSRQTVQAAHAWLVERAFGRADRIGRLPPERAAPAIVPTDEAKADPIDAGREGSSSILVRAEIVRAVDDDKQGAASDFA